MSVLARDKTIKMICSFAEKRTDTGDMQTDHFSVSDPSSSSRSFGRLGIKRRRR